MRLFTLRSMVALAGLLAACVSEPQPDTSLATTSQESTVSNVTREHIAGDVYHYGFVLRVGNGPNAKLHLHRVVRERAPWIPRKTTRAIMMLHGDFATFDTNFAPSASGVAPWLAARDIDVWGVDRRFTQAPEVGADVSDFDAMGIDQELDDLGVSLAFARATRILTDASLARLSLVGFSRGGELAYFYASREATRPAAQRHVKGLVPLDVYVSLAPEDEELRLFFCDNAFYEYDALAAGFTDSENSFQIDVGRLALTAPEEPSPYFDERTNRQAMLIFLGRTFFFFPASPLYHLLAPAFTDGIVSGFRETSEAVAAHWLANAPAHSSMREAAETDALTCGDAPLPADLPLSRIQVPLFLIAAAGGYGEHAIHSTTQVSSTDVSTLVIRQLPVEREAEDFGHGDLLYAQSAPALAWQPLLAWLQQH